MCVSEWERDLVWGVPWRGGKERDQDRESRPAGGANGGIEPFGHPKIDTVLCVG